MAVDTPKLLVVDDVRSNRMVVGEVLKDLNIEIHEAASGNEALQMVLNHEFFVILMDVNMPEMDGFETTALITDFLGSNSIAPILFVTAQNDSSSIERCYQVGGVGFIPKPIEPLVLVSKVNLFRDLYIKTQKISQLKDESRAMMESAGEGVVGIDSKFNITFVNSMASSFLKCPGESLIGTSLTRFLHDDSLGGQWDQSELYCAFQDKKIFAKEESSLYLSLGEALPVALTLSPIVNGDVTTGGVMVFRDVSERKRAADQLANLAQYDQLTGLYNRMMFSQALEQNIAASARLEFSIAIHFIDLDNFKDVNDTQGHDVGDEVIREAASRIKSCLRDSDIVARLGGDEFGVIQRLDNNRSVGAAILAQRIVDAFKPAYSTVEQEVFTGCSVGIALLPEHASNSKDLLKAADTAMYKSKRSGRAQYHFFTEEMQKDVSEHIALATALKQALENNEMSIVYQPQIDIQSNTVSGVEALLRWSNPSLGRVGPDVFIPIAESSGLISELGQWVLKQSCMQLKRWQLAPRLQGLELHVAVNISVKQMIKGDLADIVKNILTETGLSPELLKLEITESLFMENPEAVALELQQINDQGIELAIDDFGTGYSSLSYLGVLPLRWMKIDRCFVTDIATNSVNQKIVMSILSLAASLGYEVIAEGVETEDELAYLNSLGCRYIQGYFFSKPLNEEDVATFVASFPEMAPVPFLGKPGSGQSPPCY